MKIMKYTYITMKVFPVSILKVIDALNLHVIIRTKVQRLIVSNCSPLLSKGLLSHMSGAL